MVKEADVDNSLHASPLPVFLTHLYEGRSGEPFFVLSERRNYHSSGLSNLQVFYRKTLKFPFKLRATCTFSIGRHTKGAIERLDRRV